MSLGFARAGVEQLLAEHTPLPAEHGRCNLCNYVRHPCTIADLCSDWLEIDDGRSQTLAELDQWQKLAAARGVLLVAYRAGGRPPGKAIDDAGDARDHLRLMGRTL